MKLLSLIILRALLMILILATGWLLVSCAPQPEVSGDKSDITASDQASDQSTEDEILQQYPDELDRALEELDLVEN